MLKEKEGKSYRELIGFIELLRDEINLERMPHFTKINKFALRVKPIWFDMLMEELLNSVYSEEAVICSIDGTRLSLNSRSKYFETIVWQKKLFMQCNLCYENQKLIAL